MACQDTATILAPTLLCEVYHTLNVSLANDQETADDILTIRNGMNRKESDGESVYKDDDTRSQSGSSISDATQSPSKDDSRKASNKKIMTEQRSVRSAHKTGSTHNKRPARKLLESKDAYREIFNSTIEDITGQNVHFQLEPPSQIGASTWTSNEKEAFFTKLSLLGRDNLKALSAAIGTKSELEVHQYVQLLQDGVVEGTLAQDLEVIPATSHPAASEISRECEAALEVAADVLAEDQSRHEKKREAKKHGDYWLLTETVAEELEQLREATTEQLAAHQNDSDPEDADYHDDQEPEAKVDLPVPAAELLNLPNWLETSRLFMWQAEGGSENWIDHTSSKDETPSMYNTAFHDFHNLTVSLTRRILQASIFQAQSRLRARDNDKPSTKVYAADIQAATRVLNLEHNRKRFWATAPRRHGVKVYVREERSKSSEPTPELEAKEYHYGNMRRLSYDEVETRLGFAQEQDDESNGDILETIEDDSELVDRFDDVDMWTEVSYSGDEQQALDNRGTVDSDDEAPEDRTFQPEDQDDEPDSHSRPDKGSAPWTLEKQLDAQTDAMDRKASAIEEVRLWSILNQSPPVNIKDENDIQTNSISMKRKTRTELRGWRHTTDFKAEWERESGLPSREEFLAMQKRGALGSKRRKLVSDGGFYRARQSSRLHHETIEVNESSDEDELLDEAPLAPPEPAEHFGVVWSPTEARAMQPIESIEFEDSKHDIMPPPATPGMLSSPTPATRTQSGYNDYTSVDGRTPTMTPQSGTRERVSVDGRTSTMTPNSGFQDRSSAGARTLSITSKPSVEPRGPQRATPAAAASRATPTKATLSHSSAGGQTPMTARRQSIDSQASRGVTPAASAFLSQLSRQRRSASRVGTPSVSSSRRRPSTADATAGAEEEEADIEMVDASDSDSSSVSSAEIDTARKFVGPATPSMPPSETPKPVLKAKHDSDGEVPGGWLAQMSQKKDKGKLKKKAKKRQSGF